MDFAASSIRLLGALALASGCGGTWDKTSEFQTGGAGGAAGAGGTSSGAGAAAGSGAGPGAGTGAGGATSGAGGSGVAGQASGGSSGSNAAGSGGSSGSAGSGSSELFDPCRFHFGMDHSQFMENPVSEAEYLSAWAGSGEDFNLGAMFDDFEPGQVAAGKLPVLYGYVIAFTARRDEGLCDCNVTCQTSNDDLCSAGAQYMRNHFYDRILPQYQKYAQGVANTYGTEDPVLWLLEPDYYQYATQGSQNGSPLSFQEAGQYMEEMVAAIREILPAAVFSLDISPWMSEQLFQQWISNFQMSDFTFMSTSGGATRGDLAKIRENDVLEWQFVSQVTGKPIIADASYCGGNECAGLVHDAAWDSASNLNARIADGVVAVTHVMVPDDWNATIAGLRSQLAQPAHCP